MKKVKAFTLIEVIVSIAVIGILAVGMLPVMSGGLMFLNKSKEITQNIFDTQKDMELAIESAKAHASGLSPKTITLFDGHDIEVTYYEVTTEKNGKKYSTLVSESRPLEYKSLDLKGAKAVANSNINLKVVPAKAGNWIEARHDVITDTEYFKTSYQWYVSRKGFNMPISGDVIPEAQVGTIYPAFPYDYEPLPLNFDTAQLTDLTPFAGKHIVFTAEPVSIYGKFGSKAISNSIYVAESVLSEKLLVQLDASLIDESNSTEVRKSGTTSHLASWTNQILSAKSANQGNNTKQPIVKTNLPQIDYIGKYVDFGTNDQLEISAYSEIIDQNLSLYMVVRGNANGVFKHSDTTVHVADTGSNPNNAELVPIGNGWKIAKKNYTSKSNPPAGNMVIDNVDIDVAEILVYRQLNGTEELEVIDHLIKKYKLYVSNDQITKLHDISDEIFRGEDYTLPATVLATFADGKTNYVPVTWNDPTNAPGGIVDTSIVRTLNFKGIATNDPTKKVNFRLTIKPVTQLSQVTITAIANPLEIGDQVTMAYTYLPSNATIQSVKWLSSDTEVAEINSKTGILKALSSGKTMISVQANGLTSLTYEVQVGDEPLPVVNYLREWDFNSTAEGWIQNNVTGFSVNDGKLIGTPSTATNSFIRRNGIDLKVSKGSQIEIRLKNATNATSIRIEFRNTNHNDFNQNRRKTFSITANDADYKTYFFDFSDTNQWANKNNNLNNLRIYPTFNVNNQSFEIEYIKITE